MSRFSILKSPVRLLVISVNALDSGAYEHAIALKSAASNLSMRAQLEGAPRMAECMNRKWRAWKHSISARSVVVVQPSPNRRNLLFGLFPQCWVRQEIEQSEKPAPRPAESRLQVARCKIHDCVDPGIDGVDRRQRSNDQTMVLSL